MIRTYRSDVDFFGQDLGQDGESDGVEGTEEEAC